jgi:hypothetical protein
MSTDPGIPGTPAALPRRSRSRAAVRLFVAGAGLYLLTAYLLLPLLWHGYEDRHPALADAPWLTHTASGIPGDPLNVALVGTERDVHLAMLAAGWYPADPITLESSLRMATDVVFKKPFDDAPVSPLYLWGRKEDLAFEQLVGDNPRHRHHVRFWRSDKLDKDAKPLWLGAATLDKHVGLSYTTGQITHHIGPDVDAERDKVINDIQRANDLSAVYWVNGFDKELKGRNGGGDPWHTDGRLAVGVVALQAAGRPTQDRAPSASVSSPGNLAG